MTVVEIESEGYRGLQEMLGQPELSRYNLEGLISYDRTSGPIPTEGLQADTFLGSFEKDTIKKSLKSRECLFCRARKEIPHVQTCNQCKALWSGKLAVKKTRAHVQDINHGKVRKFAI